MNHSAPASVARADFSRVGRERRTRRQIAARIARVYVLYIAYDRYLEHEIEELVALAPAIELLLALRLSFDLVESRVASIHRVTALTLQEELFGALICRFGRGKGPRGPGPVREPRNLLRVLSERSRLPAEMRIALGLDQAEVEHVLRRVRAMEGSNLGKLSWSDAAHRLCMFLFRLRTGCTLAHLDMAFGRSISRLTGEFHKVLNDLHRWALSDSVICWPTEQERDGWEGLVPNPVEHLLRTDVSTPVKRMVGDFRDGCLRLRRCCGMLDGVIFPTPDLGQKDKYYVTRKHLHGINVLVVCDPFGIVRYVKVVHGQQNDRAAFNDTPFAHPSQAAAYLRPEEYILADGGFLGSGPLCYSLPKPWLRTGPHKGAAPTETIADSRRAFNTRQRWERSQIEHCFGVIKAIWKAMATRITIVKKAESIEALIYIVFALYNVQRKFRGPLRTASFWAMQRGIVWQRVMDDVARTGVVGRHARVSLARGVGGR